MVWGAGLRRWGGWLGLVAWAVLLTLPLHVGQPLVQDSFWIDIVWTDGFARELATGDLYPRWLGSAFGGLGSPVFDYYAPLGFYLSGGLMLLGLGAYAAVAVAMTLCLAASGFAMRLWLGPGRAALAGAVVYMALPYHLTDVVRRGALAESLGLALLPLLALALRRAACGRPIALAVVYAATIASHLPLALLASLFLVVPVAIALVRQDRRAARPIAGGLAAGLALSGAYLVPALGLQHLANVDALRFPGGPAAWSLLTPAAWVSSAAGTLFALLIGAVAIPAALLCVVTRDRWAALALFCAGCAGGLVPGLWALPLLAQVQFPWRLLGIAEFALATALVRAVQARLSPAAALLAFAPAAILSLAIVAAPMPHGTLTPETVLRARPDVPEYLPHGTPLTGAGAALALAAHTPPVGMQDGWTILHRFDHPRWQVHCGGLAVSTRAQPGTGLLAYRGPPGCAVTARMLPAERAGLLVSLGALVLLGALALSHGRRRGIAPLRCAAVASPL